MLSGPVRPTISVIVANNFVFSILENSINLSLIRDCAIPKFAILPLTTHFLAIGSNNRTLSMHFAGSILTFVDVSVGKGPNTIAFYIIILELPNQRLLDLGEKGVYSSYTPGTPNSWARIYPSAPAHWRMSIYLNVLTKAFDKFLTVISPNH